MQEAEIIKLASQNRVLVCPAGGDVFVLEKFPYTDLVDPSKLEQVNMVDHVPAWTLITQKQYTNEPQPQNIEGSYTRKSHQNIQQEPMPQGDDVPPVNETSTANQTTNIPQEKQHDVLKDPTGHIRASLTKSEVCAFRQLDGNIILSLLHFCKNFFFFPQKNSLFLDIP